MANNGDKQFDHYPETDLFKVISIIGIPHPFCITAKNAIKGYEKNYPNTRSCEVQGCTLTYAEHKTALVILIKTEQDLETLEKELKEYLLKCNPICRKDGHSGYAFHQESEDINPTIH